MSTRIRAVFSTLIICFVYIVFSLPNIFVNLGINFFGGDSGRLLFFEVGVISLLTFGLTYWTLFFKRVKGSLINIVLFPAITIIPYLLFSDTVLESLVSGLGGVSGLIVLLIGFGIFLYLLLLTANILNGSVIYKIPLGQAGKASQFIFSLIGTYFLINYSIISEGFGTSKILFLICMTLPFIAYWSFANVWILQLSFKQTIISAIVITLVMLLSLTSLYIWPVPSIYYTVINTIIFYVLLNIALETRQKIGNAFWVEYYVLLALCIGALILLSSWGINGTIV